MTKIIVRSKTINEVFLILSFISGFIELGVIFLAIDYSMSILQIIGVGLAYQIGNIIPNPIRINKLYAIMSSIISICILCGSLLYGIRYILFFISIICMSSNVQLIRCVVKENISTTLKRSFRIAGFFISILISIELMIIVNIIILIIICRSTIENKKIIILKPRIKKMSIIMIIHQIHYFSYSYFLIILLRNIMLECTLMSISITFILGWISYISISHFLRKDKYKIYFILGHTFLAIILLLMSYTYNSNELIVLWVMTGLGGGTVFCVKKVDLLTKDKLNNDDLVFAENIGHILGVVVGMLAYALTNSIRIPIVVAAICAFSAMLLMCTVKTEGQVHKVGS